MEAPSNYADKRALVMGKLYKWDGNWRFQAIGDAANDANLFEIIGNTLKNYAR